MHLLAGLAWIIILIYTILRIFNRNDIEMNTKLLWIIIIIVAPVVGIIIYYLFGEKG